jgi:hypothetical protein
MSQVIAGLRDLILDTGYSILPRTRHENPESRIEGPEAICGDSSSSE